MEPVSGFPVSEKVAPASGLRFGADWKSARQKPAASALPRTGPQAEGRSGEAHREQSEGEQVAEVRHRAAATLAQPVPSDAALLHQRRTGQHCDRCHTEHERAAEQGKR